VEYATEHSLFILLLKIETKKNLSLHANLNGFQSHCHILKALYEFLVFDGCMISIIFGEGSFRYIYIYIFIIFYLFLGKLQIGDKVIWRCMYNLGGDRKKQNVQKMNVHPFTSKLG